MSYGRCALYEKSSSPLHLSSHNLWMFPPFLPSFLLLVHLLHLVPSFGLQLHIFAFSRFASSFSSLASSWRWEELHNGKKGRKVSASSESFALAGLGWGALGVWMPRCSAALNAERLLGPSFLPPAERCFIFLTNYGQPYSMPKQAHDILWNSIVYIHSIDLLECVFSSRCQSVFLSLLFWLNYFVVASLAQYFWGLRALAFPFLIFYLSIIITSYWFFKYATITSKLFL